MNGKRNEDTSHRSLALLERIARLALEKKASDLVELDLRGLVTYTDRLLICSGQNERQTRAICEAVVEELDRGGVRPRRIEGLPQATWILLDYLDVVVHIFTPRTRAFYRLESLWGEAPSRRLDELLLAQDAA
jgi:ribosome-associated protein